VRPTTERKSLIFGDTTITFTGKSYKGPLKIASSIRTDKTHVQHFFIKDGEIELVELEEKPNKIILQYKKEIIAYLEEIGWI
jgi:hypothetical protein